VAFEVDMLVEQIEFCIDHHSMMFPVSSSQSADEEALLEASLVHIRLLDEFLGSIRPRYPDDIRASDWPGWSQKAFLSDDNAQADQCARRTLVEPTSHRSGLESCAARGGLLRPASRVFRFGPTGEARGIPRCAQGR
jgi:hypothetical protein